MKELLNLEQLYSIGFKKYKGNILDDGDYYFTLIFRKNDSEICITYELDAKDKIIECFVDFNCEKLKGRDITFKDLQLLIEIM